MKMNLKLILIVASVVVGLIVVAGGGMWYLMSQPLYQPGMVRAGKNLRSPLTPPPQSGDASFWQVESDIQLHHFSAGQGRPVLIIHGGPGYPSIQPWTGLQSLTSAYTFHYYDQRGCGESTRPIDTFASTNYYENLTKLDQTLGLGAQIADIERIRQILSEEKLIIIGHSFGAFLASMYAAEFPEHVEALILIAPADVLVMPQANGGLFEEVRQKLPEEKQAEYDAYLKRYLDFQSIFQYSEADLVALNNEFGQYYSLVAPVSEVPQGKAGGWMVQAMYFSMGQQHDYRSALKSVTTPVLVIHGANDLQSEAVSGIYSDTFPNAQFKVIENATHFPFEEQPQQFAEVIGEFLGTLP